MHYSLRFLILILLFTAGQLALGQARREKVQKPEREIMIKPEREQVTLPQQLTVTPVALEATIDPHNYFVGPSDVISVSVWLNPAITLALTVTPEGSLIIPNVGEVIVSDMTLGEAKERVIAAVRKRYVAGEITVTLLTPRPIVVTVSGVVLNPGLYTLTSVARANRAIEEASKPGILHEKWEIEKINSEMSTRNIMLRHKDGTFSRVDIPKFLATKEDKWNPYLREGDVIVVPRRNITKNVIGVYGEFNAPGRYEYAPGDSIKDAILIAHGLTRRAIVDSIEFTRLDHSGKTITKRIIDGKKLLAGEIPDTPLEPGDRIVVRGVPDLREDYRVWVGGEVLNPGTYPITKDRTRLSDIIQQAGGFTEDASLKSAELVRRSVRPDEVELEQLLSLRGSVSPEDSAYYGLESELRIRKEIVNVDFERLFVHKDTTQDVVLRTEDDIIVPSIRHTIYVFGQVVSPGHIPFIPGQAVSYYIRKAGGFTERARPSDVKVIKARTKQWLSPKETTVDEGDYIWIPKEPDRTFAYYMTIASQAASVLSVIAGMAVLIVQLSR